MIRGPRWRPCRPGEVERLVTMLAGWPCDPGGAARHMFHLAMLEEHGHEPLRVVRRGDRCAAAVVIPGQVLAPAGAAELIAAAGMPSRRWRLVIGDAAACDALLRHQGPDPRLVVHVQRFMTVDGEQVPSERELPDPGLRRATHEDLDELASLAVQLHVDDEFGPDPGRRGFRDYRRRLDESIPRGTVFCVGPVGAPVCKLEQSVASRRWGVQLAGIVVAPERRGDGLGRAAVAAAVRRALLGRPERTVSLHVRAANTAARRAYRAAGFVDQEEWRLAVRS